MAFSEESTKNESVRKPILTHAYSSQHRFIMRVLTYGFKWNNLGYDRQARRAALSPAIIEQILRIRLNGHNRIIKHIWPYNTDTRVCPRLNFITLVALYHLGYNDDQHLEIFGMILTEENDSCRKLLKLLQAEQCPASVTVLRERLKYIIACQNRYVYYEYYDMSWMKNFMKKWGL